MVTVRVAFSKTGRAKFISHLDLMRTMTRALRRAEIPLWYTEGFNRHPYLTFAAPLSLGYEGLHETMDFRLEEPMDYAELVQRLNAVMPEGLCILSAWESVHKVGELTAAVYRLVLSCPAETVTALLSQPTITVDKRTKKGGFKSVDIRPALQNADVAALPDGGCRVTVTLPSGGADSVNPQLFLTALQQFSGDDTLTMHTCRQALLIADGSPFC